MARCKECGGELVKKMGKSGNPVLYCPDCGKVYKIPVKKEETPEEKPVVKKPAVKRCKECGTVLVKKMGKSGNPVLYCPECKKVYKTC